MKKRITIELFEEGEKANIYTYKVNNGILEFEKFIDSFMDSEYGKDFEIINDTLDRILEKGAQERYFRPEGKIFDYLYAIPQKGLGCELRIFCLKISENLIILGNGGIKPKNVKKYQDIESLNEIAEEMQKISSKLYYCMNDFTITVYKKEFIQIKDLFI